MKYCALYTHNFKYLNEVDELAIRYNRSDTALPQFLEQHKDKTIIICLPYAVDEIENFLAEDNLKRLSALYKKYSNFKLKFRFDSTKLLLAVKSSGVPFFFSNFVNCWDVLAGAAAMQPTDMYICEELGFDIVRVAEYLHSRNIRVRVLPNIAQSTWKETQSITKFFVRPEDVPAYEPHVDVMEFWGTADRQSVLYEIYAIDKKWPGTLNELIIGFKDPIRNTDILPGFGGMRLKCDKRCLKTGKCHICMRIQDAAEVLSRNKLILK